MEPSPALFLPPPAGKSQSEDRAEVPFQPHPALDSSAHSKESDLRSDPTDREYPEEPWSPPGFLHLTSVTPDDGCADPHIGSQG
jgi:hypothetical protein